MDSTSLMLAKDLQDGTIKTSQITRRRTISRLSMPTPMRSRSTVNGDLYASFRQRLENRDRRQRQDRHQLHEAGRHHDIDFNINATSAWGNVRMRVAMSLDVTGSMGDDGKMAAMQTAAKSLIDQLSPLENPGDIYISVVPFAKDVNLGSSYYNKTWIDWSDWEPPTTAWDVQQLQLHDQEFLPEQRQDLDAGHQQMDRLRHRPHAGLRHQEHAADLVQRADDGRCRRIRLRREKSTARRATTVYAADHAAELRLGCAQDMIGTLQPTGNTNQGIGLAWGWLTLGDGRTVQRACQGYVELYL